MPVESGPQPHSTAPTPGKGCCRVGRSFPPPISCSLTTSRDLSHLNPLGASLQGQSSTWLSRTKPTRRGHPKRKGSAQCDCPGGGHRKDLTGELALDAEADGGPKQHQRGTRPQQLQLHHGPVASSLKHSAEGCPVSTGGCASREAFTPQRATCSPPPHPQRAGGCCRDVRVILITRGRRWQCPFPHLLRSEGLRTRSEPQEDPSTPRRPPQRRTFISAPGRRGGSPGLPPAHRHKEEKPTRVYSLPIP